MSNNIIYSQDTFNNQVNGTVFYREGRLEDLPTAQSGIFESWKYDFDAGRQVFRATEEGHHGRIYEKRLVKDINGVPRWTGWMEIPSGEAHGVQAIAINDRPLQLPNSDGAIKLQITPETINTYSRQEIYSLIENKIEENNDSSYEYVSWKKDENGEWLQTPVQVLMATFPEGGQISKFYLVEPRPGVDSPSNTATYFIWDEMNGSQGWVPVDTPDMNAFVTYATFKGYIEENSLPEGPTRHVVSDGTYYKAFEQVSFEGAIEEFKISMPSSFIGKSGDVLKTGISPEISSILAAGNDIVDMKLSFSTLNTSGTRMKFQTDSGLESPFYTTADRVALWDIDFSSSLLFDRILVLAEDESKKIQFNNIELTILYRKPESVEIGDGEKNLPLNLVGPEGVLPTYNNLPLNKVLTPSVEWGNITGTVGLQKDLVLKIADLLAGKVNSADLSSVLRWDVYQNTVLPSLLQQEGTVVGEEIIFVGDSSHIIYEANSPIVSGIKENITNLQSSGKSPFNYKLSIDFISSGDNAVYFETDNAAIPSSPAVKSGPFTYNWPGHTTESFDKIYLRSTSGENVEYMDDIKLMISHVTFGDTIKVEPGKKWKQDSTEYNLSADTATIESPDISFGKNAKEYGEAGDIIKFYGEEIDERYAGKTNTESRLESLSQDLQTETEERLAEDEAIKDNIDLIDQSLQTEVSERLAGDEALQTNIDSIEQSLQTEVDSLEQSLQENLGLIDQRLQTEMEERLAGDEAIQGSIDDTVQSLQTEEEERLAGDEALQTKIDSIEQDFQTEVDSIEQSLQTEKSERLAEDEAFRTKIDSIEQSLQTEMEERLAEDEAIQSKVDSIEQSLQTEASERLSNDEAIQDSVLLIDQNLQTEASERLAGDKAIQSKVEELEQEVSTIAEISSRSYEVKPFRNGGEVDSSDEDQAIDSIQLSQTGGQVHSIVSLEKVTNMHVRDSFSLNGLKIQNPQEAAAAIPLAQHPTTFSLKFNTDSLGKVIQDANGNHLVWSTEIKYILISYLAPNGDVVAERSIVTGKYASNLDTGEFSYNFGDEWTFNGWYADEDCSMPFQFGIPLTEDTSIYAGVTPTIRTITWDLAGGSPSGSYPTSMPHGTILSPPTSPVREGYEFSGWTIDGLPFTEDRAVTSNITVTATWEEASAVMMYYGSYVPSGYVLKPEEQASAGANVGAYNEEDAKTVLRSIIENGYENGNSQPEIVGTYNFERYNEGHYFFTDSRYAQGIEPAEKVYDRPFGGVGMCVFVSPFEVQQFAIGGIENPHNYEFSLNVNGTMYYAYFWQTGAGDADALGAAIEFNFQITYK